MAIRKIARMGHPILRAPAKKLSHEEILSAKIQRLILDMHDTMKEYQGIGLAAPQIYESVQLALIEFGPDNSRYPNMGEQPLLVLINPKITVLDETPQEFWEGCLSVPDLRGLVSRPRKIQVDYLDQKAKSNAIVVEDFLATVFQHELDHLFGHLYVDHLVSAAQFSFLDEYRRFHLKKET